MWEAFLAQLHHNDWESEEIGVFSSLEKAKAACQKKNDEFAMVWLYWYETPIDRLDSPNAFMWHSASYSGGGFVVTRYTEETQ